MEQVDIILIYPPLGSFDHIVRDIPLSLIYAAVDSVKNGFKVKIIDLRTTPHQWRKEVDTYIKSGASLIGLSVMTGYPILTSLDISQYIKSRYNIPIVWGGPHPTILPGQTLENEYIDYIIRDWGSESLCQLIQYLKKERGDIDNILGLGYKENGKIILNPPRCEFEMPHFTDLPYHLINIKHSNYHRLSSGEIVLPIFTAMGCPYKCSFCMSPAVYKKIKGKKWVAYDTVEVLDHIEYLLKQYNFHRLQIYDDDSFADLDRLHGLLEGYIARGYHKKLKLDFRGARINELDNMDEGFFRLLADAHVEIMAIGAESGSPHSLKLMNKGITVEQTIRVNQKLAKFPSLKPHFNFFSGIPGESLEDLLLTRDLILQLVHDNEYCYIGIAADWKPLPGTAMTEKAVQDYGLKLPHNLEEWAAIDSVDANKIVHPWYTEKINDTIKLLQIAGFILDRKIKDFHKDMGAWLGNIIYYAALLYKPILTYRLKYNFTDFLFEYDLKNFVIHNFNKLSKQ